MTKRIARNSGLVCVLLAAMNVAQAATLTSKIASALIQKQGAAAALRQIYADPGEWSELLHGIATGRSTWLRIANRLAPASDAEAREQIELALGEALEHRPANVLRLSLPVFGMNVCGGPDVDDSRFDSYQLSIRAIDRRKRMLERVESQDLRVARNSCMQTLELSKRGIAKFYGERK